jgi:hypothetical protein
MSHDFGHNVTRTVAERLAPHNVDYRASRHTPRHGRTDSDEEFVSRGPGQSGNGESGNLKATSFILPSAIADE